MRLIQRATTKLRETLTARGLIMMYHRVAEPDLDPWGLSVSPAHFAEQLEVINKYFRPLSMQELLKHLQRGKVPNRSVVVTFDDGYVDNLLNAKPLLAQYDVPATIFLVTEALVEDRNFWWDDLEWALLQSGTLPDHLELRVNNSKYEWSLGDARGYSVQDRQKDQQRRPWDAPTGTRLAFFYKIWQQLLKLSKPERIEALDAICTWSGMSKDQRRAGRALSKHEVNVLREGSLIEVGAHTVTHPSLTFLSKLEQMAEIAVSKTQLENIIGHPVTNFSYPHGDYSVETMDLIHKAGFHSGSTTNFKCVFPDADPFQLPRFQVDDWSGEEFLRRLARWYVRP
jgi:peptidoglycan/xylan/chitin deacetylase (PgdA/CDA1 family)